MVSIVFLSCFPFLLRVFLLLPWVFFDKQKKINRQSNLGLGWRFYFLMGFFSWLLNAMYYSWRGLICVFSCSLPPLVAYFTHFSCNLVFMTWIKWMGWFPET